MDTGSLGKLDPFLDLLDNLGDLFDGLEYFTGEDFAGLLTGGFWK